MMRKIAYLRKLGKLFGNQYVLVVEGTKCYRHLTCKRVLKSKKRIF